MKARDFCYWLQGYFEIAEVIKSLNSKQIEIIKNHLKMVFVHELNGQINYCSEALNFCYWLEGYFSVTSQLAKDENLGVHLVTYNLTNVFVHEIDPSFPSNQQQPLNQAHQGSVNLDPSVLENKYTDEIMKC